MASLFIPEDCPLLPSQFMFGITECYCVTAIGLLREREPGAFVIRDSHSFRGAYGLAMKVASPPPTAHQSKKGGDRDTCIYCTELCSSSLSRERRTES